MFSSAIAAVLAERRSCRGALAPHRVIYQALRSDQLYAKDLRLHNVPVLVTVAGIRLIDAQDNAAYKGTLTQAFTEPVKEES